MTCGWNIEQGTGGGWWVHDEHVAQYAGYCEECGHDVGVFANEQGQICAEPCYRCGGFTNVVQRVGDAP